MLEVKEHSYRQEKENIMNNLEKLDEMEVFFARYKISYFPKEKINNLNNLKDLIFV